MGDWNGARTCFARKVEIYCEEETYIRLISVNPLYLILLNQGNSQEELENIPQTLATELGLDRGTEIPQYVTEAEMTVPAKGILTLQPTLGVSLVYRYVSFAGDILVWIGGNVEGNE